jgi:hypothetical protein
MENPTEKVQYENDLLVEDRRDEETAVVDEYEKVNDNELDNQQSDQIDLYADCEVNETAQLNDEPAHNEPTADQAVNNENNNNEDGNLQEDSVIVSVSAADEPGLYDDVMAAPTPSNISSSDMDMMMQQQQQHEEMNTNRNSNVDEFEQDRSKMGGNEQSSDEQQASTTARRDQSVSGANSSYNNRYNDNSGGYARRVSCYVGNLTWWTNDKDLKQALTTLEIPDLVDIKFYENKINGQSKGFASVIIGSDTSFRAIMDKLPKVKINGQEPVVTPFTRFYFNQFEDQARKDMPSQGGGDYYGDSSSYNNNNSGSYNNNNNGGYNNNYNRDGYNRDGYNRDNYGRDNYNNRDNYNRDNYNRDGYRGGSSQSSGVGSNNVNSSNSNYNDRDNMSMLLFINILFSMFKFLILNHNAAICFSFKPTENFLSC